VWHDDAGLRVGLVSTEDAGVRKAAPPADLRVRSSPSRQRDVGLCSADHFCWESPLPQGLDLYGAWAAREDELWAVGASGTLLRYDGKAWERWPTETTALLTAIWGAGPQDGQYHTGAGRL